ncbi:4'-phosphopantetheinyl transferase family protein [Kitasatospora viridis]|uniref:4'-phosphopantetheinyl transferase n=1 Tax=Kitasatospora viridis TaxID=281105 RepID=A0A561UIS8_9ACTN|nr:4'-phosphopantetheinyl transferase superfamily protein [Kitasatospora viridis]TWF99250.1 4'-phosphopantetheinyl transferase [Kitasatospora viridis]
MGDVNGAEILVHLVPTGPDARAVARELALCGAAELAGVERRLVRLEHEPGGRPVLAGAAEGLQVSISHGRGLAAVALSRRWPVGVDVEAVRPVPAVPLARSWYAPAEAEWLADRQEELRQRDFFWLWTRKEAIGKALGTGLRDGGTRRPVGLPGQLPDRADRLTAEPGCGGHCFAMLPAGPAVLAVAVADGSADGASIGLRTDVFR